MVISYNQNLHFKILCRKNPKQINNLFHYIINTIENSHNNMNMKITTKEYFFLFY